ncbi:LysR family transcriptional regulator [Dactylosporangium sp. NPDC000244]|uniref:LysR family transcriptional regulator n=1 Tax=Dactylosporangium sp. NPDC000244 TaxID=3154365 RepID=UPI003333BD82
MVEELPSRQDFLLLQGVVETGSIQGAARLVGMTQAAALRRLERLERRVGVHLAEVEHGRAGLTRAGWAVLAAGARLLHSLESVLQRVTEEVGTSRAALLPTLRLAAFGSDLSELADRLALQVPGMLLNAVAAEPGEAMEQFERRQVDAVYLWLGDDAIPNCDRPLARHDLLDEPLWVALPAGHQCANQSTVDIADLAGDQWIVGDTDESTALLRRATADRFAPKITFVAHTPAERRSLLGLGHGVTLSSPLIVLPTVNPGFVLRPLRNPPRRRHVLVIDGAVIAEQLVEALRACLMRLYKERAEQRNPEYRYCAQFPPQAAHPAAALPPPEDVIARLLVAGPALPPPNAEGALEPEDLHLLHVVSECGSLNRAAPQLLITQPALTRRIGRLECRLGMNLLERTHRGTALTAKAHRLLDGVREAETAYRSVAHRLRHGGSGRLGVAS